MNYVQGFVAAVPEANKEAYRRRSEAMGAILRENGALQMVECWQADVPEGRLTSFPLAVRRRQGEAIVFSWLVWPSREAAEAAMKAVMGDERVRREFEGMDRIFDGKRMIYGGFVTLTEIQAT